MPFTYSFDCINNIYVNFHADHNTQNVDVLLVLYIHIYCIYIYIYADKNTLDNKG